MGLGALVRDSSGVVLLTDINSITGLLAPAVAEAKAILFDLSIAFEWGITHLVVESDCASVIKLLNDGMTFRIFLRTSNFIIKFSHVHCSGNMVVHSLAKLAISEDKLLVWEEDFPLSFGTLLDVFLCNGFLVQ
ncbi:hypothetical protein ACOSQ3_027487 [Xanthoceras sorbifolium]